MKKLTITLALLSALCGAQTIPQVTTNLLTFPGPAAPQVQNVFAQVVGSPGVQTYYVWVVGDYTIGNSSPSPAAVVRGAPAVLTASNYILVSWQPPSGAVPNSYDVLLTTTDTTPSGACNCAAVVATAGPQYSIVSNTLQSYTVTTYRGNTTFNVSNLSYGAGESRLTFAADQGTQMVIDNVLGVYAKAIEGVKHAEQFPGADPGARINAAEAALPATGGTISLIGFTGTQAITTQVVLDKPTVLLFGSAQFTCDGAPSPCFDATSSLVVFDGPAQGIGPTTGYGQNISYTGNPGTPYQVIAFNAGASTQTSYDAVRNLKISIDDTSTAAPPIPQVTAIYAANPVGLDVSNVFVSHVSPAGAVNNSVVGIELATTYGSQVPQPGYATINNYLYTGTAGSSSSGSGSAGIWLNGTSTEGLVNVNVSGQGNIEDAEYGIRANYMTDLTVTGPYFLQGDGTAISLSSVSSSVFSLLRTNQSYERDYDIDSSSFDNMFFNPSFAGASNPGVDNGARTTWDNTSSGNVAFPYLAGPIGGAAATSGANVNSSQEVMAGNFWNGASDAGAKVTSQLTFASGTNPAATVTTQGSGFGSTLTFNWNGAMQESGNNLAAITGSPTTGNCVEFASATTIQDAGSACGSGGGLAPTTKTSSYTLVSGDFGAGKLIVYGGTSIAGFTLPSSAPTANESVTITDGSQTSALIVTPNGLDINGSPLPIILGPQQSATITTDGTNYFAAITGGKPEFTAIKRIDAAANNYAYGYTSSLGAGNLTSCSGTCQAAGAYPENPLWWQNVTSTTANAYSYAIAATEADAGSVGDAAHPTMLDWKMDGGICTGTINPSNVGTNACTGGATTTNVRAWLGFIGALGTSLASQAGTDTLANNSGGGGAAFRYSTSAGDTDIMCVVSNAAGSQDVVSTGLTPDANFHHFEIDLDDFDGKVYFLIDGAPVCGSPITATVPFWNGTGTPNAPYAGALVTTLTAAAKEIEVGPQSLTEIGQ